MGVLIDTNRRPAIKIDVDTLQLQSAVDAAMAEFLKIITELGAGTVVYASKIGDHQFKDIDDSDDSDIFQITADDADGGVLQKTSQITDGNIWEIRATGTISGIAATVAIDYLHLDLDALVIDDGAANAIMLKLMNVDFNGATITAATLSTLYGQYWDLGDLSTFANAAIIGINAASGRVSALDCNIRGTISGRIEHGCYYFEDHFDNRQARQEWIARISTGGTGGAPTACGDLDGINEIITGGVATNEESLDFNDIFTFQNILRPTFEIRVYLEDVGNDSNYAFGLVNSNIGNGQAGLALNQGGAANQDFIIIEFSNTTHGDVLWHLSCQLDGVSTVSDGAAAAATTWVVLRFEFISDTSVEWFIDGVSQGTVATNVPTDPMQPILFVLTDAGATRYADIDYVRIWSDRA